MTLAALIRKRDSGKTATAIPATQPKEEGVKVAKIATVAVANPTEAKTAPITVEEERAIRAWLAHIEETDPEIIAEVMDKCQREGEARAYCLRRSKEVPKPDPWRVTHCGDCAKGEPEAIAGLWDTDQRYCEQYQAIRKGGE